MKDLAPSTMKTCNCCWKTDCCVDGNWFWEWVIYKAFGNTTFNKYDYGTSKNLFKESCSNNVLLKQNLMKRPLNCLSMY